MVVEREINYENSRMHTAHTIERQLKLYAKSEDATERHQVLWYSWQLPPARHVVGTLQQFHFIEDFISIVFMRAQEVIVGNPKSQVIVSPVDVIKSVCMAVGSLIGAVKAFDHLLEWPVLHRNSIVVGKSDYLSDFESKVFPNFLTNSIAASG